MSDVLGDALDEALNDVDIPIDDIDNEGPAEPQFEEVPEVADETPEEEPEVAEEPEEPEAEASVPDYSDFAKTGNPNSLPDGARQRVLSLMGEYTRKSQLLAKYEKETPAKEDQPEAPELDMNADDEVFKEQLVNLVKFHANETGKANNAELKASVGEHQSILNKVERDTAVKAIEDHVKSLPGYTDEIDNMMEQLVIDDPEWADMLMSEKGRVALFNEAKGLVGVKAPVKKSGSEPRLKNKDAVHVPPEKMYKGMNPKDKFEAALAEGWKQGQI